MLTLLVAHPILHVSRIRVKVCLQDGVLLLYLPLTDSMEKFLLVKLLVSHLTKIFQLFHEREKCILTYREAYFMSRFNHYYNFTPLFENVFITLSFEVFGLNLCMHILFLPYEL